MIGKLLIGAAAAGAALGFSANDDIERNAPPPTVQMPSQVLPPTYGAAPPG